ncbi:heavy-metal-associated domain-containing protein [Mangrovibacterium lignilyticum]|uniref:heavy-metal-associated domain-containing protein n=1 Tax=Mangrovibacterium lignilyticum TaxID=2668052 RepID=UPI0013D30CD4|nr:cation transporter [Mangrovibacterium lignilyticum]
MKTKILKTLTALLIVLSATGSGSAKDSKTIKEQVKVSGVCNQCKDRIENAALIKGVKFVNWDKEKQSLEVIYKSDKTDLLTIEKAVAEVGHDTEHVKATDEAYSNLHHCCKYREGQEVH